MDRQVMGVFGALVIADSQNNSAIQRPGPLVSHRGVRSRPTLEHSSHALPSSLQVRLQVARDG